MGPLFAGGSVAICLWTQWGLFAAGGILALGTIPLIRWVQLRRWEQKHSATVYYERDPLLTGGVSRRFMQRWV